MFKETEAEAFWKKTKHMGGVKSLKRIQKQSCRGSGIVLTSR